MSRVSSSGSLQCWNTGQSCESTRLLGLDGTLSGKSGVWRGEKAGKMRLQRWVKARAPR